MRTGPASAAFVAVVLALCLTPAAPPAPAHAQDAQDEGPVPERLCDEVLVDAADGVRLRTWVSRLAPDQPRPVLLEMESYARPDGGCPTFLPGDYFPHILSPDLIDRFTLVHVDYRGTGASEGTFDLTGPDVQRDVRDVIAWTREQPWSTGEVVLTGQSGTGFAQHHGLREAGVVAAVLYTSCADMYRCIRRGGIDDGLIGVYMAATEAGWLGSRDDADRLGTAGNPDPAQQLAAQVRMTAEARTRTTYDAWWADRSSLEGLADVDVPVLLTSDPYDIVQPFDALQTIPGARFSFGIGHTTPDAAAASDGRYHALVRSQADRFLAHHVFGEGDGDQDPPVTILTGTGSVARWREGRAYVRTESDWPLPGTRWTRLWLDPAASGTAESTNDATLSAIPPTEEGSTPAIVVSTPGPRADLRTTAWLLGAGAQTDVSADERAGLTWTTEAFEQPVELTGPITLQLVATSTTPDLDWVVRLTDVWPDGRSEWISDGYLRASLRAVDEDRSLHSADGDVVRPWQSFDSPEPVPVGEPVAYLIEVIPTSNVFAPGHRLRLDVLPAAQSGPDVNPTGAGAVTVHTGPDGSSVLLPVIDGRCHLGTPLLADLPRLEPCQSPWTPPAAPTATRVAGPDRVATAAAASRAAFPAGADVAYVATADGFADVLAGGPAAAHDGGPILLVDTDALPQRTRDELGRLGIDRIVLLGGPDAVSDDVAAALDAIAPVHRLAGPDRIATAATIAEAVFAPGVDVAYVATAGDFPDALAGGAAGALHGGPVLLTDPTALPAATRAVLDRLDPARILVLGGEAAVDDAVLSDLGRIAPTGRLAGATRYETAMAVAADSAPGGAATVVLATGEAHPDALAGAAAAGALGAPVLLVRRDGLPDATAAALRRLRPVHLVVLGGTAVVAEDVIADALVAAAGS